jgi:hypothetical protein
MVEGTSVSLLWSHVFGGVLWGSLSSCVLEYRDGQQYISNSQPCSAVLVHRACQPLTSQHPASSIARRASRLPTKVIVLLVHIGKAHVMQGPMHCTARMPLTLC